MYEKGYVCLEMKRRDVKIRAWSDKCVCMISSGYTCTYVFVCMCVPVRLRVYVCVCVRL